MSVLWPGTHRVDAVCTDAAVVRAMCQVEDAWLRVLADTGVAPAHVPAAGLVGPDDVADLARAGEAGGNAVIPLVKLLRERLRAAGDDAAADWLHRGLTSQDVLDTALMLCARDAVAGIGGQLRQHVTALAGLAVEHRGTPMVARTLTQPAVPTTFGAKVASWLDGVLDAAEAVAALTFPVQLGGAAGTLSGLVELAGVDRARRCRRDFPATLGLSESAPWHTRRGPVTRLGDAAVTATDSWGRIANDVLVLGRPEIGELAEGQGGGSSTMPHKSNPVMSVLIRRAALAGPPLAATLHTAAAEQIDERADGGWHLEWDTLATLLRRTAVAAEHTTVLLRDLRVDPHRMGIRLAEMDTELRAEQRTLAALAGRDAEPAYTGLIDDLVEQTVARAHRHLEEIS